MKYTAKAITYLYYKYTWWGSEGFNKRVTITNNSNWKTFANEHAKKNKNHGEHVFSTKHRNINSRTDGAWCTIIILPIDPNIFQFTHRTIIMAIYFQSDSVRNRTSTQVSIQIELHLAISWINDQVGSSNSNLSLKNKLYIYLTCSIFVMKQLWASNQIRSVSNQLPVTPVTRGPIISNHFQLFQIDLVLKESLLISN